MERARKVKAQWRNRPDERTDKRAEEEPNGRVRKQKEARNLEGPRGKRQWSREDTPGREKAVTKKGNKEAPHGGRKAQREIEGTPLN